ncbi:Two-component response regulator-like APRR5 [Hondaea fermentalgiana]|uniref:Two-component response regulator-like APRR5 n=1 Tax=Hondaea fermentalgiana TaxID=2315210 RepID=A0A2R5GBH4_9STRA|nr:Two-component response regulator-like APRR5 [Hondaea fermentalgiana]|eukprot:GBG25084.1 Two-component response regulator-like APRR5 [Hondaea fermentalgiana]
MSAAEESAEAQTAQTPAQRAAERNRRHSTGSATLGTSSAGKKVPEAVRSYSAVLNTLSGLLEVLRDPSQLELEPLQGEEVQRLLLECNQALAERAAGEAVSPPASPLGARRQRRPLQQRAPHYDAPGVADTGDADAHMDTSEDDHTDTHAAKHSSRHSNNALQSRAGSPNDIKVLIVDDEEVAARLMSNQLNQLKIRNEWVLRGADALNRLYASPHEFDIVLCDVNMPGLSGGEVLVRILQDKRIRDIPIVMVSTDDDLDKAKELVSAGAKDYIVKPVTQIALVSMSLKVNGWRREASTHHLNAVYDITSGLLVNVRLLLGPAPGAQVPDFGPGASSSSTSSSASPSSPSSGLLGDLSADDVVTQNLIGSMDADQVVLLKGIVQEASLPMRHLLGVSMSAIEQGSVDIFDYIADADRETLKQQLKASIFARNDERPHERKVVWRWLDANHSELPVVGSWIRVGAPSERQVLIESSSLLPTLMLKREKEMRASAERKWFEAEQGLDSALAQAKAASLESQRLKEDLNVTKKTANSVQRELNSMLGVLPDFHKMLNENPHVLTWRIEVATGRVEFVSKSSCLQILHYTDTEVVGHNNKDFLHPDDVELVRSSFQDTKKAVRIRRFNKEGETVWLESRPYAWWDTDCSIVIVTEYDITRFHGASSGTNQTD